MKKSFIEKHYNILNTEYHYTPKGDKVLIYICSCKTNNCPNPIRIWSSSSRHCGYCNDCADLRNRRKPYTYLFSSFINAQKHRNVKVDLDFEQFVSLCEDEVCHYCGSETIRDKHRAKKQSNAYMIDRKNNLLSYTIDNCVSCCWKCNDLKSDKFTYDEFLKLRAFIKTELGW